MRWRGEERRKEEMDGAIQGGNSTKALSEKSVEARGFIKCWQMQPPRERGERKRKAIVDRKKAK